MRQLNKSWLMFTSTNCYWLTNCCLQMLTDSADALKCETGTSHWPLWHTHTPPPWLFFATSCIHLQLASKVTFVETANNCFQSSCNLQLLQCSYIAVFSAVFMQHQWWVSVGLCNPGTIPAQVELATVHNSQLTVRVLMINLFSGF